MTDEPTSVDVWARMYADHRRSGLWPLLLGALSYRRADEFRPWTSGELYPESISSPAVHDPAELMAEWWKEHTEDEDGGSSAEIEYLAPYGRQWPGPAPAGTLDGDPDVFAREYATHLIFRDPSMRLGLVSAVRGADALSASGWAGPANYTDTGEISAVVGDWEQRYGARVLGVGFAELYLSVAAPPTSLDQALHIAAEHFALCPDNVWQGQDPYTLAAYAEQLVGLNAWAFWWD